MMNVLSVYGKPLSRVVDNYTGCVSSECRVYKIIDGVKTLVDIISKDEEWKAIRHIGDYQTQGRCTPALIVHTKGKGKCVISAGVISFLGSPFTYKIDVDECGVTISGSRCKKKGCFMCNRGIIPKIIRDQIRNFIKPDDKFSYYIIGDCVNGKLYFSFDNAVRYIPVIGEKPWECDSDDFR